MKKVYDPVAVVKFLKAAFGKDEMTSTDQSGDQKVPEDEKKMEK